MNKFSYIKEAQLLTLAMQDKAKQYTKLAQLALEDEIKTIRKVIDYSTITCHIDYAIKWILKPKPGTESQEKLHFDRLTEILEELLEIKLEIKEITYLGYEHSGCIISFKLKNKKISDLFSLWVPYLDKLSEDNYLFLSGGQLSLHYEESSYSTNSICFTYNEKELKTKFKEWLLKKYPFLRSYGRKS